LRSTSILESELRKLSEGWQSFLNQRKPAPVEVVDNPTSATAKRPLLQQSRDTSKTSQQGPGFVPGAGTTIQVPQDIIEGDEARRLSLLKQSADLGHSDGQYRYGRCLLYGECCKPDPRSGTEYLRRSAEQGNPYAEAEYGKCLLDGLGVGRNSRLGIEYIRSSAGKLNPRGQALLGSCFENGIAIEKDVVRAVECYRLSADQGDSEGTYNFARCLENGIGLEKDLVHATEYYRLCGVYRHFRASCSGPCRSIMIPSWVRVLEKGSFSGIDRRTLKSVTFEAGSRLERIDESAFHGSGLKSLAIPSSVGVLGKWSFAECQCLGSVTFERRSRLKRIEESAFHCRSWPPCPLTSIVIPSSVVVLGKCSFSTCTSLESVTFESGSRLERIDESAFHGCALKSIVIPSSVVVLGKESFSGCKSLESVTFESGSRLERIEEAMFADTRTNFRLISEGLTRSKQQNPGRGAISHSSESSSIRGPSTPKTAEVPGAKLQFGPAVTDPTALRQIIFRDFGESFLLSRRASSYRPTGGAMSVIGDSIEARLLQPETHRHAGKFCRILRHQCISVLPIVCRQRLATRR
jgi:TPR repeat protein